jgi:hypothetical protein
MGITSHVLSAFLCAVFLPLSACGSKPNTDPGTPAVIDKDRDGVPAEEDCDDSDASLNHDDVDGDGYNTCDGDCDDTNVELNLIDADEDGFSTCTGDCDDGNYSANPGAEDRLLVDQNCDGLASGGSLGLSDYKFWGEEDLDYVGYSVSSAGDVDGDELDDLLIAAPQDDDGGQNAGAAYIVLGASLATSGVIDLSHADYKLTGENTASFAGHSVSSAGDFDGDGLDDVLVGAVYDSSGGYQAGAAYIVLGSSFDPDGFNSISLSNADYKLVGEGPNQFAGRSVSSAGDFNDDDFDDVLVGAPTAYNENGSSTGAAYIVLGLDSQSSDEINLSNADHKLVGEDTGDAAGYSVSSAGDFDGDGLDDVLVGAPHNNAGAAYIVLGTGLGRNPTIDLSDADYKLVGESTGYKAGFSVSSAGDVDGDGLDDVLVGAPYEGSNDAGAAYIVLGCSLECESTTIDLSESDYKLVGESRDQSAGYSVSSAGDVDADGLGDIIVGGNSEGNGHSFPSDLSMAHVILGSSLSEGRTFSLFDADYQLVGEDTNDYAGYSVSSAGDVNGEGLDDVLVGAPGTSFGAKLGLGAVYLLLAGD